MAASNIQYEIADRTRAINAGGIGAAHLLVKRLGLDQAINKRLDLLKVHLPYHESDHILNIAYNLLAGNSRLEHLELLRNDEGYLDALGATRIPDPTTAGDFCRRFDVGRIDTLQEVFNDARVKVWSEQPAEFFAVATIDVDGTTVETTGECKQGMDINYKNQWGYMVQAVTLANTGEPLYVVNRPGNRPSHEEAAAFLDRAVALCRRAGFQQVRLRGDTDFSQTEHLDRWTNDGVKVVFGIQAMQSLYVHAENLPRNAWKELSRPAKYDVKTEPRQRPTNVKQQVVEERKFTDIRLVKEHVAEFRYRPGKCDRDYRIVVVWKDLEVHKGQRKSAGQPSLDCRDAAAEHRQCRRRRRPGGEHRADRAAGGDSLRRPWDVGDRGPAVGSCPRSCPRVQGGENSWINLVCACVRCNARKGGRTPTQARMKLIREPIKPRRNPAITLLLGSPKYQSWKAFLDEAYWTVELQD